MRRFLARVVNLFRSHREETELAREIESHLGLLQEDFERRGLCPEEARLAARRAYGGVEQAKELHRETRSYLWVEQLWKDIRYGWNNLLRNPGFTLVAVGALALGIGVNATIFGIYNAVALKQLPVADASRVMRLKRFFGQNEYAYRYTFAYTEYQYLRDQTTAFSGLTAATSPIPVMLAVTSAPEHANGYAVSANYFAELGVNARVGRTFLPDEDRTPGANPLVVLSYWFWQRKFHGDPNAIGSTIKINGTKYTIVGVAQEGFGGTDTAPIEAAFWAPLSMLDQLQPEFGPASDPTWRDQWRDSTKPGFQLMARLKDGVPRETAQSETSLLVHRYLSGYRETNPTLTIALQKTSYFSEADTFWMKMFAAAILTVVSLVLVVACANVANMQLARGIVRQREIGIRLALGAGRGRVVRQLLTESLLLSMLGGTVGILISIAASRVLWASLVTVVPSFQQFLVELDFSPDGHVLMHGLLLSFVTGVLFGLVPALQSTRTELYAVTKLETPRSRLRGVLLGTQITVAVLLLVISGSLMGGVMKSFAKNAELGFEPQNTYVMSASFGSDQAKADASKQRLRERFETLPEITRVSFGWPPLQGAFEFPVTADKWSGQAITTFASDGYFETLGIPILQGRDFKREEGNRDEPVAVISQATARRLWPGEDPLGKRLSVRLMDKTSDYQVIGVAGDVRFRILTEIDPLHVYLPVNPSSRLARGGHFLFGVRGNRDKALVAVESAVEAIDPRALATLDVASLEDGPVGLQRVVFRVIGTFAGTLTLLSLSLAGVGIYGVMAFLVSQRTREIGIRMALGATSRGILRSVMSQGIWPVSIGTLVGIGAALALEKTPFLGGIQSIILSRPRLSDPLPYAEIALVLVIFVAASVIPARRAMRVDPMVALRQD